MDQQQGVKFLPIQRVASHLDPTNLSAAAQSRLQITLHRRMVKCGLSCKLPKTSRWWASGIERLYPDASRMVPWVMASAEQGAMVLISRHLVSTIPKPQMARSKKVSEGGLQVMIASYPGRACDQGLQPSAFNAKRQRQVGSSPLETPILFSWVG